MKDKYSVIGQKGLLSWQTYLGDTAGCGHVRVLFPHLCYYQYSHKNIRFSPSHNSNIVTDPNYYKDKIFTIFQRSATEQQLQAIKLLKNHICPKNNMKLLYEIDDNLLDIPDWNFASGYYDKYKETVKQIIQECDGVITSTPTLKKEMQKLNKNVTIIGNKLPKFLWGEAESYQPIKRNKPRIIWAGSANHFAPANSDKKGGDFSNELLEFIRKTTDKYEWVFLGAIPNEIRDLKSKITFLPWQKVIDYPRFFKSLQGDVGIAPLAKNNFNNSKSWIKAQEFVAAGVPGVYSNVDPYEGLKNVCDSNEELVYKIESLCDNEKLREQTIKEDYQKIKNHLFWEENDNLSKCVDSMLSLVKKKLP